MPSAGKITRMPMPTIVAMAMVAAGAPSASGDESVRHPFDVTRRIPWTTSRVVGSPEPPLPYTVESVLGGRTFDRPLLLTHVPETDQLVIGELEGKVWLVDADNPQSRRSAFADLRRHAGKNLSLYGLAFHPQFRDNDFVYLCYVLGGDAPDGSRVSRFRVIRDGGLRIDPSTETVVITWVAGGHNGGCIKFGPDGFLYISTGDATGPSPPDIYRTGQDISDLASSILRIDVDRPGPDRPYSIPADNPFVETPNARPEVWAYGFRNPWKMSFDFATGDLWAGDVGWELWEMVYRIERGGNYGWSITEGRQPVHPAETRGPTPILPPTVEHPHSEAASVTGGFVYRGQRLSELRGAYIYGDYETGKMWGLRHEGGKVTWHRELADTDLQIVAFGEDAAGELYFLDYERTNQAYRLVRREPKSAAGAFPRWLSETGLFASTADHVASPGVVPYSVNAEPWADGETAKRFLALPGHGAITVDRRGLWSFPEGAVAVKTLFRPDNADTATARRLETQILHFEDGTWRPYAYAWNESQTDAELVGRDGGRTAEHSIDETGSSAHHRRIVGRAECSLCHNTDAGYVLGIRADQLDRHHDYGGAIANQLDVWSRLGYVARSVRVSGPRRIVDPHDPSGDLTARARSYLHTNCAHCHRSGGGGTALIHLDVALRLKATRCLDVSPAQGSFGLDSARIIAAGDPFRSVLYYRMAKQGPGRMPRIGSHTVDRRGLDLIYDWIASMPDSAAANGRLASNGSRSADDGWLNGLVNGSDTDRTESLRQRLVSPGAALAVLRRLDHDALHADTRREILAVGTTHADANVRDLFERFLSPGRAAQRLGASGDYTAVLSVPGDSERGKHRFFSDAGQCGRCHRAGDAGGDIGPDLSRIAEKYDAATMLRHIVDPSHTIEPNYRSYAARTVDGQVFAGLIAQRTATEVVLRDANGEIVRLDLDEIDALAPQDRSLMPEQLLSAWTPQDASDLLAYLLSLR